MMNKRNTSICTSTAIAAVLALTPATLHAQVAEAPMSNPPPVAGAFPEAAIPPPAPVPGIVIPSAVQPVEAPAPAMVQPIPTTVQPVPTQVEEPVPPQRPAARAAPADTPRAPATPERAASPAGPTIAEATPTDPPADRVSTEIGSPALAQVETPLVAELPAQAAPETDAPQTNETFYWGLAAGGLAALGLAIWGFVAIGRRKSPLDRKQAAALERRRQARTSVEPQVAKLDPQPVSQSPAGSVHNLPRAVGAPAAGLAHTGASVALPRALPERFEERDALLRRMIAAAPDRANPFRSYQARRKRARLILQSLGRDFSNTEPWIDLSQYSANWPELGRDKHAAA